MLGGQALQQTMGTNNNKNATKRSKEEMAHMKPSNFFDDITEDEFNKREQNKNAYRN